MTLHDYWDILRRSWLLVVATTVAGAAAALGLSLLMTPVYQAQSQLFVSVQSSEDVSGAYTGGLYVQQRMKSYVTVVDSPGVLRARHRRAGPRHQVPGADRPGLGGQPDQHGPAQRRWPPTPTPRQAAAIADATAKSLAAEIVRLETTDSGSQAREGRADPARRGADAPRSPRARSSTSSWAPCWA